ncbi:hypothetical protein [Chachezhania antarctica]|uniref:hypothetical protein n=1 Tax=Chachezhania antarctica TaxID=2340860 RepID=UPI001F08D936|nr:hypothetical protein [Chachezhania antarctica]|tara:strand:- start:94 stop:492 length:399 start_codon:yes stop_codon:yes gene_type:complete
MAMPYRLPAALFLSACLTAPAAAQDPVEDGASKIQRGLGMLLDGLRDEAAPTLRQFQDLADQVGPGMRDFVEEMGPALTDLIDQVEDWANYEAPEMLPNGDIIIRRKLPEPEPPADTPALPVPQDPDTTTDI